MKRTDRLLLMTSIIREHAQGKLHLLTQQWPSCVQFYEKLSFGHSNSNIADRLNTRHTNVLNDHLDSLDDFHIILTDSF